jgi:hypothetical protein
VRRLPWSRCWFLMRVEVDSSLFMKSFGRWRLARVSLLPSRRETEASLAARFYISCEYTGLLGTVQPH